MARFLLAAPTLSDAGTLATTASLAAGFPLTNLQSPQPGERTRFSAPGAAFVEIDLGSAQAITFAGLLAHNGGAGGQWRVRAAASQANLTAAPGFDSGLVSLWPASGKPDADIQHSFRLFAAQSFRWWRIDVADAGNPAGYLDVGRVMLADAWQPGRNFQFGSTIGWLDPSPVEAGVDGNLFPLARAKHRVFTLQLGFQSEDDMLSGLYEIQRRQGGSGDVFLCLDPEATGQLHRKMAHGLMVGTSAPLAIAGFNRYETTLRIEELVP